MAATYDSFLQEWGGKYNDAIHDPYPRQCMDLVAQYSDELHLPRFTGNAADVANEYPAGWIHVTTPQRGDVVVFARNAYNGYFGHIGIFDRPGWIFSQNYYPDKRCVVQPILANDRIIAILRPTTLQGDTMPDKVEESRLTNLLAQANYKLAQELYLLYEGRPATDSEARKYTLPSPWQPVDLIVNDIAKGRQPLTQNNAQDKLNKIQGILNG